MLNESTFLTSRLQEVLGWARKFSIFQYPFVTACCGMEYMATACSHYDVDRFGAGLPRFSPRQADVLFVVGTISHKIAPVLKRVYDQMPEPKWVVAFGVCTCTGGFYDNYATVMGIDTILPVDVYIPGCPPRPEMVLDGLMKLQEKIKDQHTTGRRPMPECRPDVFKAVLSPPVPPEGATVPSPPGPPEGASVPSPPGPPEGASVPSPPGPPEGAQ